MTSPTPQNGMEGTAATPYTLQKPRVPKVFHGSVFEDVEDWLAQFKWVADFNVYFGLEDGARTWYENREPFLSWSVFRHQLQASYANSNHLE